MIKRFDLRRSDNYPFTKKKAYARSGSGIIKIKTGFPVKSAIITWATIPFVNGASRSSSSSSYSSSSSSSFSSSSSSSPASYDFDILVSGFGTEEANGTYLPAGVYGGKSYWQKEDWYIFWMEDYSIWAIHSSLSQESPAYLSNDDVDSPDLATNWGESGGLLPIGTVTKTSGYDLYDILLTTESISSSSSEEFDGPFKSPRIYVHSYLEDGFNIRYENIPEDLGYFEFSYMAF